MIRPNYSVLDIADSVRPNLGSAKNMEKDSAEPNSSAESEGSVRSVTTTVQYIRWVRLQRRCLNLISADAHNIIDRRYDIGIGYCT